MSEEKYPRNFQDLYQTVALRNEKESEQKSVGRSFLAWLEEEILPLSDKDYNYKDFKEDIKKFLLTRQNNFPEIDKNSFNNRETKHLLALVELHEKTRNLPAGVEVLNELESFFQELDDFKSMHPEDISPLAWRLLLETGWTVVEMVLDEFRKEAEGKVLDKNFYQIHLERIKNLFPGRSQEIEEWDNKIKSFF